MSGQGEAKRTPQEQQRHDLAVRRICRARFAGSPHWEAYTNPGTSESYGIVLPDGRRLYPDIVTRRKGAQISTYLAEVETESSVNEAEALQWREFGELGRRFLLFVPPGHLLRARELCHDLKVPVYGYRVYELTAFWIKIREFRI